MSKIDTPSVAPGSVENNAKGTFRHDRRIEMFERTGRGVAWVGKQR